VQNNYRERIYKNYTTIVLNSAEIYDEKKINRWGESYRYYLRGWLPENMGASIAEVACGSGRLLRLLKKMGYTNISAVDISPEQVKLAKQVIENVDEGEVIGWLRTHPLSFDCIIGLDIIEHLNKTEIFQYLDACFNALKSGGELILQTVNADSLWEGSIRYIDFTHEVGFNYKVLDSLFTAAGFQKPQGRETGPIPWGHGIKSTIRNFIWQMIRMRLMIWNLAETGCVGDKIFTRVFLIATQKK
jgi:SAM-dependent methyltransferase